MVLVNYLRRLSLLWVERSCCFTVCLDCGYITNHGLFKECGKCGSLNVQHEYEENP